jgi:tetratricopeptide (TPR) repeat protein
MKKVFGLLWFFCALAGYAQTRTEQDAARYYNSGVEQYNTNRFDRAIADFTQAIMLIPNNANYYLWRGAAYFGKDEYDLAIVDLTQAISLNPNNANYYYLRGRAYAQRWWPYLLRDDFAWINAHWNEVHERAIADYEAALRLDPNHTDARKELADAKREIAAGPITQPPDIDADFFIGPPPLPPEW